VPYSYNGDWNHFAQFVMHLYLDSSPENLAAKARMLAAAAQKPDAPLEDISYCFEGIGPSALATLGDLITDHRPDVAYAAARAAAFIGDPSGAASMALLAMARDPQNPFQLNAVQTLGALPPSSALNHMLRELLDSDSNLVRIEAYKVLARNHDPLIQWIVVNKDKQKFALDIVPGHGKPIIYASRRGTPRIAIIGPMPEIRTPMMFSAMNDRLTISSPEIGQTLTIFYRIPAPTDSSGRVHDVRMNDPIKMDSNPDLSEVIQRLGGICNDDERPLDFSYSEVLAILQRLQQDNRLIAPKLNGQTEIASFLMEQPLQLQNAVFSAPSLETGRPQSDDKPSVGQVIDPTDAALATGTKK